MRDNPWTEDRIEAMKKLWEAGLSAAQISGELSLPPFEKLPWVSRNAVIGKIHRMGLSGRVKYVNERPEPKPRKVYARRVQHKIINVRSPTRAAAALALAGDEEVDADADAEGHTEVISAHDNVIPIVQRLQLVDLTDATCHWPIGDPQKPDFFFCGGKALPDLPYCPHHTRISMQPSADRRRQRPRI